MAIVDRPVRGSSSGRPIMALLDLLGRRWALRLIWELREGPLVFRALQARCGVSPSVLNTRLAELREALYSCLVEVANEWMAALGLPGDFPPLLSHAGEHGVDVTLERFAVGHGRRHHQRLKSRIVEEEAIGRAQLQHRGAFRWRTILEMAPH